MSTRIVDFQLTVDQDVNQVSTEVSIKYQSSGYQSSVDPGSIKDVLSAHDLRPVCLLVAQLQACCTDNVNYTCQHCTRRDSV